MKPTLRITPVQVAPAEGMLILEMPDRKGHYRGTERRPPSFDDKYDQEHHVNQVFLEYLEKANLDGAVDDVNFCEKLVRIYAEYDSMDLEVVAVDRIEGNHQEDTTLLGYDISFNRYLSLIAALRRTNIKKLGESVKAKWVSAIVAMIIDYMELCSNQNHLIVSREQASMILAACVAIQQEVSNLWLMPSLDGFEVVSVRHVYP